LKRTRLLCRGTNPREGRLSAETQRKPALEKKAVHNPEPRLIRIDADDGVPLHQKLFSLTLDVSKLLIAHPSGRRVLVPRFELLVVDSQGVTHLFQQPPYGAGADADLQPTELLGDFPGGSAAPFQILDRIPSRFVLEQMGYLFDHCGVFFSARDRPPPMRRIRPRLTSCSSSCSRPRATVCTSRPRNSARSLSPPCPSRSDSIPANKRRCCSSSNP